MAGNPEVIILPSASLPSQPWAVTLHDTIIKAFKRKDIQAFPPSWTRLDPNPALGMEHLAGELGPQGFIAAMFIDDVPIGCGGFLPFRGNDWIDKEKSAEVAQGEMTVPDQHSEASSSSSDEWEICCFCIRPDHRKQGLSKLLLQTLTEAIRQRGGRQLAVNYSREETGDFWPRLGLEPVAGATSILRKGFTHTIGMEGLREDLHFQIAKMLL